MLRHKYPKLCNYVLTSVTQRLMEVKTMWDTFRPTVSALKAHVSNVKNHVLPAGFGLGGIVSVAGGTIGNYTSTQTPTDITEGAPGILSAFGMLVDMMIYIANEFFLKSAMGQIYIAMACLLFTFILVKGLLRHSSGRKR